MDFWLSLLVAITQANQLNQVVLLYWVTYAGRKESRVCCTTGLGHLVITADRVAGEA